LNTEEKPVRDGLRQGRVVQELGGVSIVEMMRDLKYGRVELAGYCVLGGAGDPDQLHTFLSAEAELLRRNWHGIKRKR